jgi:peptidoglycan-associated lipoprotein
MKRWSLAFLFVLGVILAGVSGCATQSHVQKQINELQDQIEANRAEIAILTSSDAEQNDKLSKLSDTVQDAVNRVQLLREVSEVKFLYKTTINDDGILFGFNSRQLSEETKKTLDAFAIRLKDVNRSCYIEIQGHTDNQGPKEYNFQLGLDRARVVMSYLYMHHGIPLNRMNTFSYGASKPIADNGTPSERAKNRRVTLLIMAQATSLADAESEKNSNVEDEYVEQENEGQDDHST